jgi:predicted  nucleic acid-binding Zn-ribbon protein
MSDGDLFSMPAHLVADLTEESLASLQERIDKLEQVHGRLREATAEIDKSMTEIDGKRADIQARLAASNTSLNQISQPQKSRVKESRQSRASTRALPQMVS